MRIGCRARSHTVPYGIYVENGSGQKSIVWGCRRGPGRGRVDRRPGEPPGMPHRRSSRLDGPRTGPPMWPSQESEKNESARYDRHRRSPRCAVYRFLRVAAITPGARLKPCKKRVEGHLVSVSPSVKHLKKKEIVIFRRGNKKRPSRTTREIRYMRRLPGPKKPPGGGRALYFYRKGCQKSISGA